MRPISSAPIDIGIKRETGFYKPAEGVTVFLTHAEYDVEEFETVEAGFAEEAGLFAVRTFIAGLDDGTDDRNAFEEIETEFIRSGV